MTACGSGDQTESTPAPEAAAGAVSFSLVMEPPPYSTVGQTPKSLSNCFEINTVAVVVMDGNDSIADGEWPCDAGKGTITGVAPGRWQLIALGYFDDGHGNQIYFYESDPIRVLVRAGETTKAGDIAMHFAPHAPTEKADWDGDGFLPDPTLERYDCDDTDPDISPDAAEICNGIDDNCNGQTDEGVQNTYYRDADSDGYGNSADSTMACSAPEGYVENANDCNDENGAIHPGMDELCNAIDDNCNKQIDEGVQITYYRDTDGDGYGDATNTTKDCRTTPPAGYTTDSADCDDGSADIKPGGDEIWNGKDDNCNGEIDEGSLPNIVWYVDGTRSPKTNDDGRTWDTAFTTIQAAVDAATPGVEIWVRSHQYDLGHQVEINKQVALLGGFAGDETYRSQRDWVANTTTISGGNMSRCLYLSPESDDVIIDGFTIKNDFVDVDATTNDPYPSGKGGALYIEEASLTILNCHLSNNEVRANRPYGGAISIVRSPRSTIMNCTFTENSVEGSPSHSDDTVDLSNGYGGAIAISESNVEVESCLFESNVCFADFSGNGGAIYQNQGKISISSSFFFQNRISLQIEAYAEGGAVSISNTTAIATNSIFADNTAEGNFFYGLSNGKTCGGGIHSLNSTLIIKNCTLFNNHLGVVGNISGGGIYFERGTADIVNSILWNNSAKQIDGISYSSRFIANSNIDQNGIVGTNNNVRIDPLLNPDDYHLTAASLCCIDAADPATAPAVDIDGDIRGPLPDIGADEYPP